MKLRNLRLLAAAGALTLFSVAAHAIAVPGTLQSQTFPSNDCAGDLGNPPNCTFGGSPMIAKFDWDGSWKYTAGSFPSITGSEFTLTGGGGPTGTFTYTPGAGDPLIKFWSVKAGNGYTVYWFQSGIGAANPANAVAFSGGAFNWATIDGKDISHITFFDSVAPSVPEPATLGLLGLGLLGAAAARRRRKA